MKLRLPSFPKLRIGDIKTAKFIKYTLFTVSAIFTVLFMTSQSSSMMGIILMGLVAVALEASKYNLAVVAVTGKFNGTKLNRGRLTQFIRIGAVTLALALYVFSIFATMGFTYIETEAKKSTTWVASDEYNLLNATNALINSEIVSYQTELQYVSDSRQNAIEADRTQANMVSTYNTQIEADKKTLQSTNASLQEALNRNWKNKTKAYQAQIIQLKSQIDSNTTARDSVQLNASSALLDAKEADAKQKITGLRQKLESSTAPDASPSNNKESGYELLFGAGFIYWVFFALGVIMDSTGIGYSIILGLSPTPSQRPSTNRELELPIPPKPPKKEIPVPVDLEKEESVRGNSIVDLMSELDRKKSRAKLDLELCRLSEPRKTNLVALEQRKKA